MTVVERIPPASPPTSPVKTAAPGLDSVDFFGSQVGDENCINYSYTDDPLRLLLWDTYYFFYYIRYLPWVIFPYKPTDSGDLDELAFTSANLFCIAIHAILIVLQLSIIALLPLALLLPLGTTILIALAFAGLNKALCTLLNGRRSSVIFTSNPRYAPHDQPRFAHEKWIFINGVAAGEHWMQNDLDRLALTFGRPVTGIHNRTSGIIFDVIECLIQRNFGYATRDVRTSYRIVKETLYDPRYSKVVFVLHSQGGVEGGMVLDWLLQELPQNLLAKLEVYSFGNAANHFNNPYRSVKSQDKAVANPVAAAVDAIGDIPSPPSSSPERGSADRAQSLQRLGRDGSKDTRPPTPSKSPSPTRLDTSSARTVALARSETDNPAPATSSLRAIGHIEHYAYTTDFVANWGVLHFATSSLASKSLPRFVGRLFVRTSPDARGGHQFVQHYMDGMFPLRKDGVTGKLLGCAEENAFMESVVTVGEQKECQPREGVAGSREGEQDEALDEDGWTVMHPGGSPISKRKMKKMEGEKVKVKELSRLWKYRNGRSPAETPPLLASGADGLPRNATM